MAPTRNKKPRAGTKEQRQVLRLKRTATRNLESDQLVVLCPGTFVAWFSQHTHTHRSTENHIDFSHGPVQFSVPSVSFFFIVAGPLRCPVATVSIGVLFGTRLLGCLVLGPWKERSGACGAKIRGAGRRGAPSTDDHFDTPFMLRQGTARHRSAASSLLFSYSPPSSSCSHCTGRKICRFSF